MDKCQVCWTKRAMFDCCECEKSVCGDCCSTYSGKCKECIRG